MKETVGSEPVSGDAIAEKAGKTTSSQPQPSPAQLKYLKRGLGQAGGKLPLFDEMGQEISPRTIRSCIDHGWAEPWFENPVKPDWLVCKLTPEGAKLVRSLT